MFRLFFHRKGLGTLKITPLPAISSHSLKYSRHFPRRPLLIRFTITPNISFSAISLITAFRATILNSHANRVLAGSHQTQVLFSGVFTVAGDHPSPYLEKKLLINYTFFKESTQPHARKTTGRFGSIRYRLETGF